MDQSKARDRSMASVRPRDLSTSAVSAVADGSAMHTPMFVLVVVAAAPPHGVGTRKMSAKLALAA